MNDFSELEKDLRKLRPASPSPVLFERVEQALEGRRASVSEAIGKQPHFAERIGKWWSLGFGLAAAAVLILFAVITMEHRHERQETVAQSSAATAERPVPHGTDAIDGARQIRFDRGDQSRLQRARRRTAFCRWLGAAGATPSVSDPTDLAVAQSGDGCIASGLLSERGNRSHPGFRSMI